MIEKLLVKNFQCHERLSIELGKITTVVGSSDVGKSAIVRALRWATLNRPGGSAFVRDGSDGAKVTVHVDGHRVVRLRGSDNAYVLDGNRLKAFGTDVPADVAKVLGLSEFNFQRQLDPPFWFGLTPGEVSKELNAVVDLSSVDTTLAHLNAKLRRTTIEVGVLEGQEEEARKARKRTRFAKAMNRDLKAVEQAQQRHIDTVERFDLACELVQDASRYQSKRDRLSTRLGFAQKAIAAGEAWAEKVGQRDRLREHIEQAKYHQSRSRSVNVDFKPLFEITERVKAGRGKLERLASMVMEAQALSDERNQTSKSAIASAAKYKELIRTRCPICLRPMNKNQS